MSYESQKRQEIMEAYFFLREKNQSIPSDTLELMKDAALESLVSKNEFIGNVSGCPYEAYAVFCIECDRQGIKPIKHKDFLALG